MIKRYINKSSALRVVVFEDGSAQFLMRGQSVESDKPVKKVQEGIVVKDLPANKKKSAVTDAEE